MHGQNHIKFEMDVKRMKWKKVGWNHLTRPTPLKKQGQMAGSCQHCHKFSVSVKGEEGLD